jgi:hypothetical protein
LLLLLCYHAALLCYPAAAVSTYCPVGLGRQFFASILGPRKEFIFCSGVSVSVKCVILYSLEVFLAKVTIVLSWGHDDDDDDDVSVVVVGPDFLCEYVVFC